MDGSGAVVAEGGQVTIDRSKLDASNLLEQVPETQRRDHRILYRVISFPRHGALNIRGRNLTRCFSQVLVGIICISTGELMTNPSVLRSQPDFSQVTLNRLGITYIHDDSETTNDSFTFQAWVAPSELSSSASFSSFSPYYSASSSSLLSSDVVPHRRATDTLAVTEKFNITVTPVNDQPPLIRSRSPSMKVVVGEKVVLGPENLQVRR